MDSSKEVMSKALVEQLKQDQRELAVVLSEEGVSYRESEKILGLPERHGMNAWDLVHKKK